MEPNVVIVLVNWNGYRDTVDCISSILNSNYSSYKIIVVDNGSSNQDFTEIEKHAILVRSSINLGFAGGANLGVKYALENFRTAKYILLLDNDVEVDKDFLGELVMAVEKTRSDIASSVVWNYYNRNKVQYVGRNLHLWREVILPFVWSKVRALLSKYNNIVQIEHASFWSLLIRRDVFDKIGLLDDSMFWGWEDIEFCLRTKIGKIKMIQVPSSRVFHKSRSVSRKNSKLQYYSVRNKFIIMRKYTTRLEYILFVSYMLTIHISVSIIYHLLYKRDAKSFGDVIFGLRDGLLHVE